MNGFHVDLHAGTAVVTIDRPKANAIDAATSKAMGEVFARLDGDAEIRAIILTGAGPKSSRRVGTSRQPRISTATTAWAASADFPNCPSDPLQ